jgi:hypothetical protein
VVLRPKFLGQYNGSSQNQCLFHKVFDNKTAPRHQHSINKMKLALLLSTLVLALIAQPTEAAPGIFGGLFEFLFGTPVTVRVVYNADRTICSPRKGSHSAQHI